MAQHGLPAIEDRRHRHSDFRPPPEHRPAALNVISKKSGLVLDFGAEGPTVSIPVSNDLQTKVFLLTLLQNGVIERAQVADLLEYSPTHIARMARQLADGDIHALLDKRQGQQQDYRVTPEVKAELVQQFAVDVIARGKTSGEAISAELQERCQITIPARTVRHHLARMGLPGIRHSLPELLSTVKKNFVSLFLSMKERLPALAESLRASGTLIQRKVERRASMAALSLQGIDPRTIAVVTQSHAYRSPLGKPGRRRWTHHRSAAVRPTASLRRSRATHHHRRLLPTGAPTARSQPVVVA